MTTDVVTRARSLAAERLSGAPRRWAHVQGVAATAAAIVPVLDPEHADEILAARGCTTSAMHPISRRQGSIRWTVLISRGMLACPTSSYVSLRFTRARSSRRSSAVCWRSCTNSLPQPREILDVVTFADMTTSPTGEPIERGTVWRRSSPGTSPTRRSTTLCRRRRPSCWRRSNESTSASLKSTRTVLTRDRAHSAPQGSDRFAASSRGASESSAIASRSTQAISVDSLSKASSPPSNFVCVAERELLPHLAVVVFHDVMGIRVNADEACDLDIQIRSLL